MDLLIAYALQFVNVPYRWAGNSPLVGIDCSGLVCELMRSVGLLAPRGDLTAQALHDTFSATGTVGVRGPGVLAFYGQSVTKITHVAFMVDPYRILEAGGGGHEIQNVEEAIAADARVRMRLLTYRADLVATVKPRYGPIGLV